MEIDFHSKKLETYANDDRKGSKALGQKRFNKYKMRLDQMRASKTLEDLRHQPGRFHELKSNRKGQWACDLDHPYRLIFEPCQKPIPENEDGQYLWLEIKAVEIIEIEDYH